MTVFSLYVATVPNGKKYVGCTGRTVQIRSRDHRFIIPRPWPGDNAADFSDAVKRYGPDSITFEHVACAVGAQAALEAEIALIAQHQSMHPHGYNRNSGGPVRGARKAA